MKRIATALMAFALCASLAQAYEAQFFTPLTLVAGTTNSATIKGVRGKIVYAMVYQTQATGTTNAVSITTAAGVGVTLGAARTVVASTNVTTTAVASTPSVYCWNDTLTMTAISSGSNVNTGLIYGVVVLEQP